MNRSKIDIHAAELDRARVHRAPIAPLSCRDPSLTIDDAYAISLAVLQLRLGRGERLVGKKIGVTSKAVQDMLGVNQPDFGFLTESMWITDEIVDVLASGLIQPRAEAEIAFFLSAGLPTSGVSEADVLAATQWIAPCFEIVDSRILDWRIGIIDTIADNASCGVFAIGEARADPRRFDLPSLKVTVKKNGVQISEGFGSAVQGSPLAAVAWLANTLGGRGVRLEAGDLILSGSVVPLEDAAIGDRFEMDISGIGGCKLSFA